MIKKDKDGNIDSIFIEWSHLDISNELNSKQKSDVLGYLYRYHDADIGINWQTVEYWTDQVRRKNETQSN
tara:strand:+ start:975 stop:1184 length:210 start_codon:yes stop_codon:yes gene_type:complete